MKSPARLWQNLAGAMMTMNSTGVMRSRNTKEAPCEESTSA